MSVSPLHSPVNLQLMHMLSSNVGLEGIKGERVVAGNPTLMREKFQGILF